MPVLSSLKPRRSPSPSIASSPQVALFETAIGWFGMLGGAAGLTRLVFAHTSPLAAREALGATADDVEESDWSPQLRKKLESYALGKPVRFDDVPIVRARPLTQFQQRVVEIVRAIPRGETLTYAEVATLAGAPGAARAVGTVMSSNPAPIIVPCHRVVGSAGGLGGYSAAGGIRTKQWMLDLESDKQPR